MFLFSFRFFVCRFFLRFFEYRLCVASSLCGSVRDYGLSLNVCLHNLTLSC